MPDINIATAPTEAIDFLRALAPGTKTFQFQHIHDQNDTALQVQTLHLDDLERLKHQAANGFGTFFTVNEMIPGARRTAENVTRIRAVYADDDNVREHGYRTDWKLPPSLIVESSQGKFHYYWLIEDEMSIDTAEAVKKSIATTYGTDWAGVAGPNRVLRLPGFPHQKKKNAFISNYVGTEHRYKAQEIIDAFGTIALMPKTGKGDFEGEDYEGVMMLNAFILDNGLIRAGANKGEYKVVCPWHNTHTNPADRHASLLFAGTGGYVHTTFHCHHDSCIDKSNRDVQKHFNLDLADLEVEASEHLPDKKPAVFETRKEKRKTRAKQARKGTWHKKYILTKEQRDDIDDREYLIPDVIVKGYITMFVAPPNGGKTSLLWEFAKTFVENGMTVYYVNADISAADAKVMSEEAERLGINLLLPDMQPGLSMATVVEEITAIAESEEIDNADLSDEVYIFDTLKKMTDVIRKEQVKELFKMFRQLTGKQATVVPLGHTNKFMVDDKYVYEGTGDVKSDADVMFTLYPEKKEDRSVIVSSQIEKERAPVKNFSFTISPEREVNMLNQYIDTKAHLKNKEQMEKDLEVIEEVKYVLSAGAMTKTKLVDKVREIVPDGQKAVNVIISRYDGEMWNCDRVKGKNAIMVSKITP